MIERFYSGDYNENFSAVCDEIYLPFWGINEWYESKKAYPFPRLSTSFVDDEMFFKSVFSSVILYFFKML